MISNWYFISCLIKREVYDSGDEDEFPEDNNEEQPTVVVLKSGDLTAEEAKQEEERIREREDKELIESGKIIFKSAKKRNTEPEDKPIEESKKPKKERSPGRIVKTKCLLSFDDEVDEEDWAYTL